jgi:hypothetical protein
MGKAHGISGGGIESRQTSQVHSPKAEPREHHIDPTRPSQIGLQHWQNTAKAPLYQSSKASTPFGATPGNDCRPGGNGRVIMRAGSQSTTPAPRPMGSGRSLFK